MQNTSCIALAILGMILAAIGGFGSRLLLHFRGRTLEAYCRLKGNRELFGKILDEQDDAQTACNYLFILGSSIALISLGAWISIRLQWGLADSQNPVTTPQLISMSILAAAALACLHSWIPKIIVRNSASVLLYHTWWYWHTLNIASRPIRTLEHLFLAVGHRLSDRRVEDRIDEESLEDEVRKMIMAGERDGLVTRSMRDMITGVMNLDEGQVSQIMTPRSQIDAIDISWGWEQVTEAVIASGRTRIPVFEESLDNILGILYVKDLMTLLNDSEQPSDASSIRKILRETWMIPATRKIDELLKDFLLRRNHMAIVVDEFQQTLGVVTIEDALEEIVGEIADERDTHETMPMFVEDPDGGFSIAGVMEVSAANRQMALLLPESDEYETVAGLVISSFGVIPKVGTKTKIGKYQLSVSQASARQVLRIRVSVIP